MKNYILIFCFIFLQQLGFGFDLREFKEKEVENIYNSLSGKGAKPSLEVFKKAVYGFIVYKNQDVVVKNLLSIVDFSLSSKQKRLWVIDLDKNEIKFHEWVAHGKNSGYEYATHFSNVPSTNKSSLGFYVTHGLYKGQHGLSLRLNGLESEINHNARQRAIVMHGAHYVSPKFIDQYGRLGRSYGCPAVRQDVVNDLIPLLADGTCLFIYHPNPVYQEKSTLIQSYYTQLEQQENPNTLPVPVKAVHNNLPR
ncbi:MAG: murein L,D-transpeptidase catalytic domain family protein [Bacteroidota bacterium]